MFSRARATIELMDVQAARTLAQDLLELELPGRWRHVQAVAGAADRIADRVPVNRATLVSAAWLHDIGYAPLIADSGFHPLDGARHLRRAGWPADVCRLVAHHTCARTEAGRRGFAQSLDEEFPDLITPERDALWVADVTTGPDGQRMTLDQRVDEISARYGPSHVVTMSILASRTALQTAFDRLEERKRTKAAH